MAKNKTTAKKRSIIKKSTVKKIESKLSYVFPITLIVLGLLMMSFIYLTTFGHAANVSDLAPKIAETAYDEKDYREPPVPPMAHGDIKNYVTQNNKLVPVLMYHHVRDYVGNDAIERGLSTQPSFLVAQLKWLKDNGFTTITFPDLFSGKVADKSVILTFDDGYLDNYTAAFPELKKNGQKATFFIISGAIGGPSYMTKAMWKEMSDAGMDIESHTINHIDMGKANKATLDSQLTGSKSTLEAVTGKPVQFICYPSGQFSPLAEAEARAAGYKAALTTQPFAKSNNLFEIPRVRMNPGESPQTMAGAMASYLAASNRYNWIFQ